MACHSNPLSIQSPGRRLATLTRIFRLIVALFLSLGIAVDQAVAQDPIDSILQIEKGGQNISRATAAAEQLLKSGVPLGAVLAKAEQANPVAKNWLLSIAQVIADKQPAASAESELQKLLDNQQRDGGVRYWALDRLAGSNKELRAKMLDGRTSDSSLDIRYEAIELAMKKLPAIDNAKADEKLKASTLSAYESLLKQSRLPDQINHIAAQIKALGSDVDLRKHFGFVANWQVIGPFDNRGEKGYPVIYPPEADYLQAKRLDSKQRYQGKAGEVAWQPATTEKADGQVDLNPVYSNEKGAVVYAYTTIECDRDVECQIRYGTPNANKAWINGAEVATNDVYHTGSAIDQYWATVQLKKGTNTVLLKICQNEQTQSWAQDFGFKVRFSDVTGAAIPVTQ